MEIQLYKALTAAGINAETAADLTAALERDIRERIGEARKELATKSDVADLRREIAEAKSDIIKWNMATLIATAGLATAIARLIP